MLNLRGQERTLGHTLQCARVYRRLAADPAPAGNIRTTT